VVRGGVGGVGVFEGITFTSGGPFSKSESMGLLVGGVLMVSVY